LIFEAQYQASIFTLWLLLSQFYFCPQLLPSSLLLKYLLPQTQLFIFSPLGKRMPPLVALLGEIERRFVPPLPPSTYIAGAKLSVKLIIAIVFLIFITILSVVCICCICIRRAKSKRRAARLAKLAVENKALPPKINKRNAKFFAPGLYKEVEQFEMDSFLGQRREEVKRPERVRGGWREVMRGVTRSETKPATPVRGGWRF
jgi:hypothetical protein